MIRAMDSAPILSLDLATRFADVALANVVREFPNKLDHVMDGPADVRRPRELHPVFYGSFDFHSCVHMHWLLARVRRLYPDLPQRAAIAAVFDRHLTDGRHRAGVRVCGAPGFAVVHAHVRLGVVPRARARIAARGRSRMRSAGPRFWRRSRERSSCATSTICRSSAIRCAPASIRTVRSDCSSRSTMRAPPASRRWPRCARIRHAPGSPPTATRPRNGSRPAPISCRRCWSKRC